MTIHERAFLYLPFEHSECLEDQRRSVAFFEQLAGTNDGDQFLDYAREHLRVIERFGRFPYRNAALARTSTPDEIAFLENQGTGP